MLILGAAGAFWGSGRSPSNPYSLWSHPPFRGQTRCTPLE
jgi:hypothetical protein